MFVTCIQRSVRNYTVYTTRLHTKDYKSRKSHIIYLIVYYTQSSSLQALGEPFRPMCNTTLVTPRPQIQLCITYVEWRDPREREIVSFVRVLYSHRIVITSIRLSEKSYFIIALVRTGRD